MQEFFLIYNNLIEYSVIQPISPIKWIQKKSEEIFCQVFMKSVKRNICWQFEVINLL